MEAEVSYTSKKGKKLSGKVLDQFLLFWEAFGYKYGKAEAADAWLAVKALDPELFEAILEGARREASRRPEQVREGKTPKWAQGWLTGRRWEDEGSSLTEGQETAEEILRRRGIG